MQGAYRELLLLSAPRHSVTRTGSAQSKHSTPAKHTQRGNSRNATGHSSGTRNAVTTSLYTAFTTTIIRVRAGCAERWAPAPGQGVPAPAGQGCGAVPAGDSRGQAAAPSPPRAKPRPPGSRPGRGAGLGCCGTGGCSPSSARLCRDTAAPGSGSGSAERALTRRGRGRRSPRRSRSSCPPGPSRRPGAPRPG